MTNYTRQQMILDDTLHYNWEQEPKAFTGAADELPAAVDKHNGYEVLALINVLGRKLKLSTIEAFQEMEYLLHYGVPTAVNSPQEIEDLLLEKNAF